MTVYNFFYQLIAGIKLKCVVHSKILMFYSTVFLDLMKLKLTQHSIFNTLHIHDQNKM